MNCFLGSAEDLEGLDEEEIAMSLEEEKEEELYSIKGELFQSKNFKNKLKM